MSMNFETEYKICLQANKQLREENKQLKAVIDKLRMDLDEYGQVH